MYYNLQRVTSGFTDKAKEISQQTWLSSTMDSPKNEAKKLLSKLENTIKTMPSSEIDKLYKKFTDIIPDDAQYYLDEYDEQFISVLVEILGWGWLKSYYNDYNPKFIGTPDLIVTDSSENPIAAMECKRIRESDEDRDYFKKHQGEVKDVNTSIVSPDYGENPFLRKLTDTLCKAEKQLGKVKAANNIIFMSYSWDVSAILQEAGVIALIKNCAPDLLKRGVYLIAFSAYQSDKPFINTFPK